MLRRPTQLEVSALQVLPKEAVWGGRTSEAWANVRLVHTQLGPSGRPLGAGLAPCAIGDVDLGNASCTFASCAEKDSG